ncbi:MAG: dihydropteroate synthase [Candidatus Omnitrophota bacterium]
MRIIDTDNIERIRKVMQAIGADNRGIKIMAPKGILRLIKLSNLNSFGANILKQEMLSIGGDVCLSRNTLTGKARFTDCLIMGTLAQYQRLINKLKSQPEIYGIHNLAQDLCLSLKGYHYSKTKRTKIMGIINLTPDSFSGDGLLAKGASLEEIIGHAQYLIDQGAEMLDLGGESTRPGAQSLSVKEELKRIIPVIKRLAKRVKVPISIDTYKPLVAQRAVEAGARIINDITGLRNPRMIKVVAKTKARVIIMHMKGMPRNMQVDPKYKSLLDEIIDYLDAAIKRAEGSGVSKERIIIDPGIGFGKSVGHNLEIIRNLREFKVLGCPVLIGPSRKSFIGKILKLPPQERLNGTLASLVAAVMNGVDIVRVHDIKPAAQAVKIADTIIMS